MHCALTLSTLLYDFFHLLLGLGLGLRLRLGLGLGVTMDHTY